LRNFLLVLLLINLGVLAWYHWLREAGDSVPIAPGYEGLPSLALPENQPADEPGPQVFSMKTGQELLDAGISECRSIGPFSKADDIDRATQALQGLDYSVARRSQPGRLFVGYWVNIAKAQDRGAAEVITNALRADGVTDFYIVPSGDDQNAISLGVFSELERAQRRLQQLSDRGFEAQVNQRYQDGEVTWLEVSGLGVGNLDIGAVGVVVRDLEIRDECPPG
jgi:hypothetical protein